MEKDHLFSLRLPEGDFQALKALASAERTTIGAVVRRAILRELGRARRTGLGAGERAPRKGGKGK